MEFNKGDLYNLIQNVKITGHTIDYVQGMPDKFKQLPCISYCNFTNNPKLAFQNQIYSQDINVQIDIWSNGSSLNTVIFLELCNVMQENGWQLIIGKDIGRNDKIFRTMTKWRKII